MATREHVLMKRAGALCVSSCAMDDNDHDEFVIMDLATGEQISDFHLSEEGAWDEAASRLIGTPS